MKTPRVVGRSAHRLLDILTIAILAVICGAEGWEDMEDWATDHADWLRTFLDLPNGIPQHDCHRRVFAALAPGSLVAALTQWMQALVGATDGELVALDGETMRRSFDRAHGRSALLAAWFAEAVGTPAVHTHTSTDGGHGRVEVRTVHVSTDVGWFADRAEWKGLGSFVMVESERDLGSKVQRERRYFLCSLATHDAAAVESYVRDHWSIENLLHWTLDVTFREDDSRIRDGHGPENFALLRKLALVLLKRTPFGRRSLKQRRRLADRNPEYLASVLAAGVPSQ